MSEINKSNVGRGAAYLYIEAISLMFSGYIYWLILSKITSPSEIGISSTIVSLSLIFMTVASLGVSYGIQGYIGRAFADRNIVIVKGVIKSSLLIVAVGLIGTTLIMVVFAEWIYGTYDMNIILTVLSIAIMSLSVLAGLLRAIIIPSLKTKVITISSIVSTIVKIIITIILVILGTGIIGILFGYMLYPIVSIIILAVAIKKTVYEEIVMSRHKQLSITANLKEIRIILNSSLVFWTPNLISIIGSQLGTVSVFVANGAEDAGIYFIAFSIVTGISIVLSVFSTIAFPTLSAMKDGRKRAVWRLITMSLLITWPLSNFALFYSNDIMRLFGNTYVSGSSNLVILLLSILPSSIIVGVTALAYSYSNNRQVLNIGLFTSIPRVFLYLLLAPVFGGNGAALTYLVGSLSGCIISLIFAKRIGLKIEWKSLGSIALIPTIIIIPFKLLEINYVVGTMCALLISYILFYKLHILEQEDVDDILRILPRSISKPFVVIITKISNKIKKT